MFGKAALGILLIKAFVASGYFAFFHNKPKKIEIKQIEGANNGKLAVELNVFIMQNPSDTMNELVTDLNWILKNDYQRDIRVKRIIHQDLKGLVDIHRLVEKLERVDPQTQETFDNSLKLIAERVNTLRYAKDETIRNEILMLGEMIEGNDR